MERQLHASEGVSELTQRLSNAAGDALKQLLETKHLYQHVTVALEPIIHKVRSRIYDGDYKSFDVAVSQFVDTLRFCPSEEELFTQEVNGTSSPLLVLLLRNVKLFCAECGERETFSPIWHTEVTNEINKICMFPRHLPTRGKLKLPPSYQLFLLVYQCQHCQGTPEAFLVRRNGWHLTLDGRSPMEHVDVPKFIPRQERGHYRDALVAMHGGKTLAALFYLRTFIEQFGRRQTGLAGKQTGEVIMKAYNERLPLAHRDHMPLLRYWYDRLSEAIHEARPDEELFEKAKEAIEQHFDIRRVFKIPEATSSNGNQ